jgi:hypothetical protein
MGFAQQSLIAVRNEIMQVCAQMPVDGTNVVALEQILVMCETILASEDRTHVRIEAWKKIYPNHVGTITSDHLTFDDGDWMPINDDDSLNLDDDDGDDDDDSLDLNDDDFYRDPEEKLGEYTQDECDGYLLPLSFAQDNLPVTDNSLTDHEFALLFGLVPPPLAATESATPLMWDIFGNPLALPTNLTTPSHADSTNDTYPDPDPDYNVPGSI